jgi:hypothetical protein
MRKLAIVIICLLALVTLINAYTGDTTPSSFEPERSELGAVSPDSSAGE